MATVCDGKTAVIGANCAMVNNDFMVYVEASVTCVVREKSNIPDSSGRETHILRELRFTRSGVTHRVYTDKTHHGNDKDDVKVTDPDDLPTHDESVPLCGECCSFAETSSDNEVTKVPETRKNKVDKAEHRRKP